MTMMKLENFNKAVAFVAEAAWRTAERHYERQFKRTPIRWGIKGRTAGRAFLHDNEIMLNLEIAMQNQVRFLARTVPHEVAHHIEWQLWRSVGHGERWRSVMKVLGVADNSPTHDYDLSQVAPARITHPSQYKLNKFD